MPDQTTMSNLAKKIETKSFLFFEKYECRNRFYAKKNSVLVNFNIEYFNKNKFFYKQINISLSKSKNF